MYYSLVQTVILLIYGITLVRGQIDDCVHFKMEVLPSDPTQWIEQPLDHFNESDSRNWKMKYYKIMKYWKPEGPILLYLLGAFPLPLPNIGKEREDVSSKPQSFVNNIAEETGAAYFMLEHRYYGESLPFNELTTANLAYLTSRQALEDLAQVLKTIKTSPELQNSKVIVVGGFYAGNLAVWLKQLYPELIDAVLASSAPLLAKKEFIEALETVTDAWRTYGSQECVDKIAKYFNNLRESLGTPEGIEKLKKEFHICEYSDMTNPLNQQLFFQKQMGIPFILEAIYGTPVNITSICQAMNSTELENRLSYVEKDDNCKIIDFDLWVALTDEKIRCWYYQLCNEFGYIATTSSSKQMFGNFVPIDYDIKICSTLFGEEFNEERVEQGVMKTNKMYGGLTPNVTNVIFVNGDMDPWQTLGIVKDLSANAPAIFINGSAHCHDFYPHLNNNENVKKARKQIVNLLKKWIGQAL